MSGQDTAHKKDFREAITMKKGDRPAFILVILFLACHFCLHSHGADSNVNRYFVMADKAMLTHDYQNAIDLYFKGLALYSDRVSASGRKMKTRIWDDIGFTYWKLGDLKKAEENLKKALECYEKYLYLGGSNVEEAQKCVDALKKINNHDGSLYDRKEGSQTFWLL